MAKSNTLNHINFSKKIEYGFDLYIKKDLTGAINAFTEVINNSTDQTLEKALDSRAACYEKLPDLHLALRDGRNMIRIKPDSSKLASFLEEESKTSFLGV
ncbi:hypothetical protein HI914_03105 [Erysiphe necator]|nr:hypothetical protein HI914_03105 [Erysiphe necator]